MDALSLRELERQARGRLDPAVYDFFAGGADDEVTVRANEAAFARLGLLPRTLRGGRERDLAVTVLGRREALPVVVARRRSTGSPTPTVSWRPRGRRRRPV
jgi:4-hydroxymandelate oxidase